MTQQAVEGASWEAGLALSPIELEALSGVPRSALVSLHDELDKRISRPSLDGEGSRAGGGRQIAALSAEELAQFRAWFAEFDWASWDRQLEADIQAGKLDRLAEEARRDHEKRKTTPL